MVNTDKNDDKTLNRERYKLIKRVEDLLEGPMVILGFAWLAILLIELVWGSNKHLQRISDLIWIIFIVDFLGKFILAPKKLTYLKKNILTLISLIVPALRVFRIFRAFRLIRTVRAARGLNLVKVIGSINRGMGSLNKVMQRHKFGYVMLLTLIVSCLGAAGMLAFEKDTTLGLNNYGKCLWWTAMLLTSIGSEFWPHTPEGRTLCFLLSLYGFAVFGYFTATLASFFMGQDALHKRGELVGTKHLDGIENELINLRKQLEILTRQNQNSKQ